MPKIESAAGLTANNFIVRTVDLDTRNTISVNAGTSTISDSQNQFLSADGGAFAVGDEIRISYIDTSNPNAGTARITAVTAGTITIENHSGTLTTEPAGADVNIVRIRKTFELVAGQDGLDAIDGAALAAIVRKLYDLFYSGGLERFDTAIDETFPLALVSTFINGWEPHNQATLDMIRDGAIQINDGITGDLKRSYMLVQANPLPQPTHRIFYWWDHITEGLQPTIDAVTPQFMNQLVLIYDRDLPNSDFRTSTLFLKLAEPGYLPVLVNLNEATNTLEWYANIFPSGIQTSIDPQLADATGTPFVTDTTIDTQEPYTSITFTQQVPNVNRTIEGVPYPFDAIIERSGATKQQVHQKLNRQIRHRDATDIDAGPGFLRGEYSGPLSAFIGNQITFLRGYADNTPASEANDTVYTDANGIERRTDVIAALTINYNTPGNITLPQPADLKVFLSAQTNTDTAQPINDASGVPMIHTFTTSGSVSFSVRFASFNQFGHPAGTPIPIRYTISADAAIIPFARNEIVENNVVQAFPADLLATTVGA